MQKALTSAALKQTNRRRIYQYVYQSQKPVTKQEIAGALELSLPTVSNNLNSFLEEGLLAYSGTQASTGGGSRARWRWWRTPAFQWGSPSWMIPCVWRSLISGPRSWGTRRSEKVQPHAGLLPGRSQPAGNLSGPAGTGPPKTAGVGDHGARHRGCRAGAVGVCPHAGPAGYPAV